MKHAYIILILSLFQCCVSKTKDKPINDIFNPRFDLTFDYLSTQGFEAIPEDVPLLGKQFGDTLVYFQFSDDPKKDKPIHMFYQFQMQTCDSIKIANAFVERNVFILTDINCETEDLLSFFISSGNTNLYYRCTYDKDYKDFIISFDYPKIDFNK